MKGLQRIWYLISALFMILGAAIIVAIPKIGYSLILFVIAIYLLVIGIRYICYFFSLSRHMVGGQIDFFKGLVLMEFGAFILSQALLPQIVVMLFATVIMLISGCITAARSFEMKKNGVSGWSRKLIFGIVQLVLVLVCLFALNSVDVLVWVYAIWILTGAIYRIYCAFRPSAMVYIA